MDSFQVSWGSLQINPNLRVLDEDSGSATDSSADANVFQVNAEPARRHGLRGHVLLSPIGCT